ncbi:NADH dehydrogenase subunit 2 [Iris pallida]|uniref:NADH dehydrogenase subunit 2 (Mitochondrion) n=1 Tax=Iris pallida TaxID=29817 RepID=A0AAX6G741_IRIPA|nr:NADH dehydrogenase subunit 2 [Iris pallida]
MLHKSAAFSGVLSHSCPTRRATRSVVLSHKISTSPACWPGESKFSSGQLSTQSSTKNTVESSNARCWCASCPRGNKSDRQGSDLTVCSMEADYPRNPWEKRKDISVTKTIGGCIGEIQR